MEDWRINFYYSNFVSELNKRIIATNYNRKLVDLQESLKIIKQAKKENPGLSKLDLYKKIHADVKAGKYDDKYCRKASN